MTRNTSSAAARRTLVSTLGALVLAAALPQAGFAAGSDAGIWQVIPAQSKFRSSSVKLTIERVKGVSATAGSFIVISKGSVYLLTGAAAYDGKGVTPVDYRRMAKDGRAVLIGMNVRSGHCGFACQSGLPEQRLTVTFDAASRAKQQINDMLAERTQ